MSVRLHYSPSGGIVPGAVERPEQEEKSGWRANQEYPHRMGPALLRILHIAIPRMGISDLEFTLMPRFSPPKNLFGTLAATALLSALAPALAQSITVTEPFTGTTAPN